jgi:tRNA modification GTPase
MDNQKNYNASSQTIAAISTPQALGGIGIVRISGPRAREIAGKVFFAKSGKTLEQLKGYSALYGRIRDESGDIDEAIALNFVAPASFTGENVVELSCHGGLYIMRRVLKAVFAAGAVPAGPGEFTRRAFLNGKIGLTEAESVMQLISAQGEQAVKTALAAHDGALEKKIIRIRSLLIDTAAHLSAWADYPEDDIPQVNASSLEKTLITAKIELAKLLNQFDAGRAIREGVRTVIAGRPNVGKSTLMNLLSGCERSIVTEYAGTTRDVVEDTVILGGVPLLLSDTAGIHGTDDPVEKIGVDRARAKLLEAQLVLAVFDSSRELDAEDTELISFIQNAPAIAVLNKTDLSVKIDISYIEQKFKHIVYISALSGEGLPELTTAVSELLQTAQLNPADGILFTERQRDAARNAAECVEEAVLAVRNGMTLDAITVSIESAVAALLELTGERATEAVVDSVFAHFCVGK